MALSNKAEVNDNALRENFLAGYNETVSQIVEDVQLVYVLEHFYEGVKLNVTERFSLDEAVMWMAEQLMNGIGVGLTVKVVARKTKTIMASIEGPEDGS